MKTEYTVVNPAEMDPTIPSPLTVEDLDELKHANLWAVAKTIALDSSRRDLSANGRFIVIYGCDLASMISEVGEGGDPAVFRAALLEFFLFQQGDGHIPMAVGDETGEGWTADHVFPSPLVPGRVALMLDDDCCNELWLVQGVARYFHGTGDRSLLSEIAGGRRVNQRLAEAMECVFRESARDADGLLRTSMSLAHSQGEPKPFDPRARQLHVNLLGLIALNEFIKLPDIPFEVVERWISRRGEIASAVRRVFWDEDVCKLMPRPDPGLSTQEFREMNATLFFPLETAMAVRAGLLTHDEIARSLRATMNLFHNLGPVNAFTFPRLSRNARECVCPWIGAQIASAYSTAGFPGHAMEILRPIAEHAVRNGRFCPGCSHRKLSLSPGHCRCAAGAFVEALSHLGHSDVIKTQPTRQHFAPPASSGSAAKPTFGRVGQKRFTFKKIEFDEKREVVRLPLEFPVEFKIKAHGNGHKHFPGGILHPSETGLGLESKEELGEGLILELNANGECLGEKKHLRLRGRVRWSKPKIASRLFISGVELDARSKDLKRWRKLMRQQAEKLGSKA